MSVHSSRGKQWDAMCAYIRDKYEGVCQYGFGGCTYDTDLTVDHIVAKVNGGTDDEHNLTLACRKCNSKKRERSLVRKNYIDVEWMK